MRLITRLILGGEGLTLEQQFDLCVVGGGLVGLSVARAVAEEFSGVSILLVEKEDGVARHQSSHNSGVVHSGLYYRPGSLKAQLCTEGRDATYRLCDEAGIAHEKSGKLVIATEQSQLPALDELERRGTANGLTGLRRIGPDEIAELEPAAIGIGALHVPEAGVADFPAIAAHHASTLQTGGAVISTGVAVTAIAHKGDGVKISTTAGEYSARALVNCAGLHSDRVAAMAGIAPKVRIVPFRGEYYQLSSEAAPLVRHLIYPVPDPRFPFLGVHFTRRVDGAVEVGPNAILGLGREHYRGAPADWTELRSIIAHPGFRRLALRHWWSGTSELLNSRSKRLYARQAQRLVPELRHEHLRPGGAGVRAQAVDTRGNLVDDFVIEIAGNTVHVLNAPSPGATASIAIGRHISERVRPFLLA
ncbi:MAG: L-2-hydroxyglutarate oxidase [Acidimicrobiia bacterium]